MVPSIFWKFQDASGLRTSRGDLLPEDPRTSSPFDSSRVSWKMNRHETDRRRDRHRKDPPGRSPAAESGGGARPSRGDPQSLLRQAQAGRTDRGRRGPGHASAQGAVPAGPRGRGPQHPGGAAHHPGERDLSHLRDSPGHPGAGGKRPPGDHLGNRDPAAAAGNQPPPVRALRGRRGLSGPDHRRHPWGTGSASPPTSAPSSTWATAASTSPPSSRSSTVSASRTGRWTAGCCVIPRASSPSTAVWTGSTRHCS